MGVFNGQNNFGPIALWAILGAGKDDIFHAATAQGLGGSCPHHPAQGFQEVGFATAIGADNACQPFANLEIRWFYK